MTRKQLTDLLRELLVLEADCDASYARLKQIAALIGEPEAADLGCAALRRYLLNVVQRKVEQ